MMNFCFSKKIEKAIKMKHPQRDRESNQTIREYINSLIESSIINRELAIAYVEKYEKARFGSKEIGEEEYQEFAKSYYQLLQRFFFSFFFLSYLFYSYFFIS